MRKRLCTLLSLALVLWALPAALSAQDCISGTAYEDLNNNGMQDAGENGLDGVEIIVIGSDGTVNTTISEMDGSYNICVAEGMSYHVYPSLPNPDQFANPPHYDLFYDGTPVMDNNFGIADRTALGFLGGDVFYDLNADGRRQAGEPVPLNAQLVLDGPLPQTLDLATTGSFSFRNLPPGDYTLSLQVMLNGATIQGGAIRSFTLAAGMLTEDNIRYPLLLDPDFGAVSDAVCYDLDANGINDPIREPGINNGDIGIEVLNDAGEVIAMTSTDAAGRYIVTGLDPGNYQVRAVYDALAYRATTPENYDLGNLSDLRQPGPFYFEPLQKIFRCGMAASTFGSEVSGDLVLAVKDIRDRTGVPASNGNAWAPTPVLNPNWNDSNLGEIFGMTTDEADNLYVTASRIPTYAGNFQIIPGTTPLVYHIEPFTGGIQPLCIASAAATASGQSDIFNSNRGIGNITSDKNGFLYLTNISDGTIVVIQDADQGSPGQVVQVYTISSFAAAGILNEYVWGIGYNVAEQRVYFAGPPTGGGVNIYSVAASGGIISGPEVLETTVSPDVPVADIAFSADGTRMLIAQRQSAHYAFVYQYSGGSTGSWSGVSPMTLYVGAHGVGSNSSGGVDYAYSSFTGEAPEGSSCETIVAASGNALNYPSPAIYGFALIPAAGNSSPNGGYADAADFPLINSILIDNDINLIQVDKGYQGDVEVFDCDCEAIEPPDCAEENGLRMLPDSPAEPAGVGDCCHILNYDNPNNVPVHAIDFTLLDGVQFQSGYQWDPGLDRVNYSSTSVTFTTPGLSGPLPNSINGLFNFCLENITGVPQFMVIDYRDENFEVFCTDTLEFFCPLQAECLEYVVDSLVCDSLGYKFTIDFEVPPGTDFDIGYIKMNLGQTLPGNNDIVPIGPFADPNNSGHVFPTPLMPGDQVSLMYMITTMDDLFGDSLCIIVTAHDDLDERLCCYAYEECIPFPDCPEPCEEVSARVVPAYQGDAASCCGGDPLEYQWLQDLIGDCTQRPCGAEVFCCELEDGTRVIHVAPDPYFGCADFPSELYGCDGTLLATSGGIAGGELPPLVGCRKIYDCFEPDLNECCFDLLLTDTFTFDPGLITNIQTTILNSGVTFSGQDRLGALLNGWTPTDLVPDRDILWTHNSGVTPNGVDQYLFSFCVEGTTSTDSVYVEVDFLSGRDSIVCTDTVAVYCPYCLQVVNDSLSCVTDAAGNQTYLYEFSFINSSAFDVNAVRISDQENPQDTVLNGGIHMLGSFVPPGATYTGTIPVQFAAGLDSACFDIVLRQIIGDSINIACCYATHCIELPPCDELEQRDCPEPGPIDDIICLDVYEPVCGCDGRTYSNICYAERANIPVWTPGPCDNINEPGDDVNLVGQATDAGNQLNWTVMPPPRDYVFFVVQKWENNSYWSIANIPATGDLAYDFLDLNAPLGISTYRILAVSVDGSVTSSNTVELLRRDNMGRRTTIYSYPSPARDELHVTVNRLGEANLELLDVSGQVSHQENATFNGNPHTVDVSRLSNGVFIVRLRFDDGEVVQQRVVRVRE